MLSWSTAAACADLEPLYRCRQSGGNVSCVPAEAGREGVTKAECEEGCGIEPDRLFRCAPGGECVPSETGRGVPYATCAKMCSVGIPCDPAATPPERCPGGELCPACGRAHCFCPG